MCVFMMHVRGLWRPGGDIGMYLDIGHYIHKITTFQRHRVCCYDACNRVIEAWH